MQPPPMTTTSAVSKGTPARDAVVARRRTPSPGGWEGTTLVGAGGGGKTRGDAPEPGDGRAPKRPEGMDEGARTHQDRGRGARGPTARGTERYGRRRHGGVDQGHASGREREGVAAGCL